MPPPPIDTKDTLAYVLDEADRKEQRLIQSLALCLILGCVAFACILVALHYRLEQDRRVLSAPLPKGAGHAR